MTIPIVFFRYKFVIQAVVGGQRANWGKHNQCSRQNHFPGFEKKESHNRIAKIRVREIKQYNSILEREREREMEAKKAAAGTSLESLMSSFNTRIAELQDLVIARNSLSLSLLFFVQSGSSTSSSMDVDVVVCKLQCTRRQA